MYATKAQEGSRGIASLTRKLGTRSRRTVSITSDRSCPPPPVLTPEEIATSTHWRANEPVCMSWRKEKSPASAWNRNVIRMSSVPQPTHYTDCPQTALHISKDESLRMNNKLYILFCTKRTFIYIKNTILWGGVTWGRSWLRQCVTSRKVAGSIPKSVIVIFRWYNPSGRTMAQWLTQPLTEMSKSKGKEIPLQAWTGPEGSRRLRFPDFKTTGTWMW